MKRIVLLALTTTWLLVCGTAAAQPAQPLKTLRYAFPIAESTFDPAPITDLYSRTVVAGIFEAPLEFAFMARPAKMRPNTAAAMPEISADFRTFTFRIQPGIFFADDAAFQGRKRELVAEDYVYSIKRHYDPRWKSGNLYILENAKILGLSELRKKHLADKTPFNYDTVVEGLRTLDRYTFQVKLADPAPRFLYYFADGSFTGAVAREVVEFYGDRVGDHPVGTGPFRLAQWKRSSRIVLEKNPSYREVLYNEEPPEGDARLQAIAKAFKGRRLPLVDRVQIAIIEEPQPRWLSFLNEEQDVAEQVPAEFAQRRLPEQPARAQPGEEGRADGALPAFRRRRSRTSAWRTRWSAATSRTRWRCAVPSAWRSTWSARSASCAAARPFPAQSPIGPEGWGYDPSLQERDERVRPRPREGAARHARLRRPRRRRLARPARRPAAGAGVRHQPRPAEPPAQRAVAEEHGCDQHPHRVQDGEVARAAQGQPRRQADDVGRGLERGPTRRRHLPRAGLRPEQGPGQPRALRPAGLQRAVRAAACAARRPRARGRDGGRRRS